MWEESAKEIGLPPAALAKLSFTDGYPKVYTEADPLAEDSAPVAPTGKQYKKVNWLKAGIIAADKVLTVSPNYATEITASPAGGVELDTYLR